MIANRTSATGTTSKAIAQTDVVLIGGGIMSATLGTLLQQLAGNLSIEAFERSDDVAIESSNDWNNAGTGHASLCEMNYTPERDGVIETEKAVRTNEQFHESRVFWARMVEQGVLSEPDTFVRSVPHMSYVSGVTDVHYLQRRYDALRQIPLFESLEYSDDHAVLDSWVPLMMDGREPGAHIAMTRSVAGTDVNFGELTRQLFRSMAARGATVRTGHEVIDLEKLLDARWRVTVREQATGRTFQVDSRFVFVGAGGHAIHLLQKSGIREARSYGGFPVSGQFLRAQNPDLIERHYAKVYGKPQVKAPPMSMPHLDTPRGERRARAPVRAIRRFFAAIPQARLVSRPGAFGAPKQPADDAYRREGRDGADDLPREAGATEACLAHRCAEGFRAAGEPGRLGADACRHACPDDEAHGIEARGD